MLLEERRLHMVARCEETLAVHGSGEPVETKLHRIAEKARKEPDFKFTSLYQSLAVPNNVLLGYRALKTNLFSRDLCGYWNQCTSRIL